MTYVGYYNFLYGSLIVTSNIGCVASGGYHGGMNICGWGGSHPNHLTSGLNGGPLGGSPPSESPGDDEHTLLLVHELVNCYRFDVF